MGYCFMNIDKISNKNKGVLGVKYNHNYRKMLVLNADPDLFHKNDEMVKLKEGQTYTDAVNERLQSLEFYKNGGKIRSNNVLAYEIIMTFSKEDAEKVDTEKWKKDNVEWLKETFDKNADKYGSNILSVMCHEDEGNIHIHAIVTPIDERGRLNAFSYTGSIPKLRALQDSYAAKMEQHGLKRGIKGSKATHQDIKRFYTALNQEYAKHLPEPEKGESIEHYHERVDDIYVNQNLKVFSLEKKIERLEIEKDSLENQHMLNLLDYKKEKEKEKKEMEEKYKKLFGDIEDAKRKIEFVDMLNDQIDKCPVDMVDNFHDSMDKIMMYNARDKKDVR